MEKKQNGITRRDFLKGAAAGSLSVAAMGLLGACANENSSQVQQDCPPCDQTSTASNEDWLGTAPVITDIEDTKDYDVVVIGAGHAGTAAARKAAELGKKVALLEAQAEDGYMVLGNDIGHLNSKWQAGFGVPVYDEVEFMNNYQVQCAGRANPDLLNQFAYRSGEAFDWFISELPSEFKESIAILNWPPVEGYEHKKGLFASYLGSSTFSGEGYGLQQAVLASQEVAKSHGAEIFFGMKGAALLKDGNRITGAIAQDQDGKYHQFNASVGVVLSAGDFSGNTAMYTALCTEVAESNPGAELRGNGWDGSGIKMGLWAGGRMEIGPRAAMGGAHCVPLGPLDGAATLWLNKYGKRFCNEGFGGPFTSGVQGARQPNGNIYGIFGNNYKEVYLNQYAAHFNAKDWTDETVNSLVEQIEAAKGTGEAGAQVGRNTVFCADTLEDLAKYLGMNEEESANMIEAVNRYNEFCKSGIDKDYGKDASLLFPIEAPYFGHAFPRNNNMVLVTLAGLFTDGHQNCVDENFEPIPGLYASGNCCGGRFPLQYTSPMNGISIGMALALGYTLGEHLGNM